MTRFAIALMRHFRAGGSLASRRCAGNEASLIDAADAFDKAQIDKDSAALDRMVADDLVFIDGSGKRLGKKAFIEGWTAPVDRFDPIMLIDRTVTPLGPDAAYRRRRSQFVRDFGRDAFLQPHPLCRHIPADRRAAGARCIFR